MHQFTSQLNDESPVPLNVKNNTLIDNQVKFEEGYKKHIQRQVHVPVQDYIKESYLYHDIEIKTNDCENSIKANRIILAASSPLLENCLNNHEDEGQIVVMDCSIEVLKLAIDYLHFGFVQTADERQLKEVEAVIERLEIGKSLMDCQSIFDTKYEPLEILSPVKIEPVNDIEEEQSAFLKKENKINMTIVPLTSLVSKKKKEKKKDMPKKSKEKKFDCSDCDRKFSSKVLLDNHVKKRHSGTENTVKCEHCPKTFSTNWEKNKHEQVFHIKPFKCDQCGASFGRKANLDGHVRLHTGEKPFTCDICGRGFPLQSGLATHKKQAHSAGKRDWACDLCENR